MKSISISIVLLLLPLYASASEEAMAVIQERYTSPDGSKYVTYVGLPQGEGSFYHGDVADGIKIFDSYFRYGPMVKWLSEDLIEFKIPTGSPNFHNYYYRYSVRKLSDAFNLVKGIDVGREIVVCAPDYDVEFYDIFSGNQIFKYTVPELEENKVLGWTHVLESQFNTQGQYVLKYFVQMGDVRTKVIDLDVGDRFSNH